MWMTKLANRVLADFNPNISVRIRHIERSFENRNGRCWNKSQIIIIACPNEESQETKAILLHELAHLLIGNGCHNKEFFYLVELLYTRYGVSKKVATKIEEVVPRPYWLTSGKW